MPSFTTEIEIAAPVEDVWSKLADLGNIAAWNPGVESSHVTTDQATGVGAGRHCELPSGYLDETVREWDDGERLVLEVVDSNMPMAFARPAFDLEAVGEARTRVQLTQTYEMKYGPLGVLLDKLVVNRMLRSGMDDLLAGLKDHVERSDRQA